MYLNPPHHFCAFARFTDALGSRSVRDRVPPARARHSPTRAPSPFAMTTRRLASTAFAALARALSTPVAPRARAVVASPPSSLAFAAVVRTAPALAPRARTFASGLTVDGGVNPAVDAVPESIVLVPREARPEIDGARGIEVAAREVFGVVQVRSHQFKVSPDDLIYVDKISGVEVNDVVSLPRVLMLGNKTRTVIGRPTVPGAEVVALVEEHVRDGKKLIFKKKRRKNHRRMRGYRAQLTGLRVLEVRGIDE